MRRYLGPRSPVASSITTLANIDLRDGNYKSAIETAEQALNLSRAINDERRTALALICLAEAQRRYSGTQFVTTIDEKVSLLRGARDHAYEALDLFKKFGELNRQVEALIEIGCACRDWYAIRRLHPNSRDNTERLFEDSKQSLHRAASEAERNAIMYRKIDALVDLAWLGAIANSAELIDEANSAVWNSLGKDYLFDPASGKPHIQDDQTQVLIWPYLGKLEIMHGHRAYQKFEDNKADHQGQIENLREFATRYFWGLQYSIRYSEDYDGMNKAKDQIYERIKTLSADHLREFAKIVIQIEQEYKLKEGSAIKEFLQYRALWYNV